MRFRAGAGLGSMGTEVNGTGTVNGLLVSRPASKPSSFRVLFLQHVPGLALYTRGRRRVVAAAPLYLTFSAQESECVAPTTREENRIQTVPCEILVVV